MEDKSFDFQSLLPFHFEDLSSYKRSFRSRVALHINRIHLVFLVYNRRIKGYFYEDDYIGEDPGDLFAVTSCFSGCFGNNSAKPLESDKQQETR